MERICNSATSRRDMFDFITNNKDADPSALRLKYHGSEMSFDTSFAILQIECRAKYRKKLRDTLDDNSLFLFPDALAGEQSTSDILARYHASLVPEGAIVVDLTAGLGIDAMHIARNPVAVVAVEIVKTKAEALKWNASTAGIDNLTVINGDCTDHSILIPTIERLKRDYRDAPVVFFVDPARRAEDGSRVYAVADCSPDVRPLIDMAARMGADMIMKLSPMLDITAVGNELSAACPASAVSDIIALGTHTECKELLCRTVPIDKQGDAATKISAVTLDNQGNVEYNMQYTAEEEARVDIKLWIPMKDNPKYLYIPYPATMKASPVRLLSTMFDLQMIHGNTHLFVADHADLAFPGEVVEIVDVITYESKNIKRLKKIYPAIRVTARNFGITADTLRKKLGVADRGERRLVAVTASDGQKLMIIV